MLAAGVEPLRSLAVVVEKGVNSELALVSRRLQSDEPDQTTRANMEKRVRWFKPRRTRQLVQTRRTRPLVQTPPLASASNRKSRQLPTMAP